MKVYAVIAGGWDCDAEYFNTLRLFDCKSAADAYRDHLVDVEGYDYALLREQEVCLESAILPAT